MHCFLSIPLNNCIIIQLSNIKNNRVAELCVLLDFILSFLIV